MPNVIPFGDCILCRRRKVGSTLKDGKTAGGIVLPESIESRPTDLADVVQVPDLTFSDKHILDNADGIVKSLTDKAVKGNTDALEGLLKLNTFIKLKSVKVGDAVFISKYVGTDFHETGKEGEQTLVRTGDILGLVMKDE